MNPFDESTDARDPLRADSPGARIARRLLGPVGRLLARSKTAYRAQHPTHCVLFNANICTAHRGKIWFGDLDLAIDSDRLDRLATALSEPVYVVHEFDARFAAARAPNLAMAIATFPSGRHRS